MLAVTASPRGSAAALEGRGYVVPEASHGRITPAACSGRVPVAEHRVRSMSHHLLTATNATSCRTTLNHKHPGSPVVRVVQWNTQRSGLADLLSQSDDRSPLPLSATAKSMIGDVLPPSPERHSPVPLSSTDLRVWNGQTIKRREDGSI